MGRSAGYVQSLIFRHFSGTSPWARNEFAQQDKTLVCPLDCETILCEINTGFFFPFHISLEMIQV